MQLKMLNTSIILPGNRILLNRTEITKWTITDSSYITNNKDLHSQLNHILKIKFGLDIEKRKALKVRVLKKKNNIYTHGQNIPVELIQFTIEITKSGTLTYNGNIITKILDFKTLVKEINIDSARENDKKLFCNGAKQIVMGLEK